MEKNDPKDETVPAADDSAEASANETGSSDSGPANDTPPAPPAAPGSPEAEIADTDTGKPTEIGGRGGADPTRFGDWEIGGRCVDF